MSAARDLFRTPDQLVLQDRLLSLGLEPWHVGIETHTSGCQSNHFPFGVSPGALLHLLTALRVHRDDATVGALGPGVCESLWDWAQWPIPAGGWARSPTSAQGVAHWVILGDTRDEARRIKAALEAYADEHAPGRPGWYRGAQYNWRGCWQLLSAHRASRYTLDSWPQTSLLDVDRWPLVFGASRQSLEDMRLDRVGAVVRREEELNATAEEVANRMFRRPVPPPMWSAPRREP